jgi:hypothetical protein
MLFQSILIVLLNFTQNLYAEEANPEKSYEDFAHEFKGCPENSTCDELNGKRLLQEVNFFKSIKDLPRAERFKKLQLFYDENGISLSFLMKKQLTDVIKPILFQSHCKEHDPKVLKEHIYKSQLFVTNISYTNLFIKKENETIKYKLDTDLYLNPLIVKNGNKIQTIYSPQEASFLMMENDTALFLIEKEEVYFILAINEKGSFIKEPPESLMPIVDEQIESKCSDELKSITFKYFNVSFCKTITKNKNVTELKFFNGCL